MKFYPVNAAAAADISGAALVLPSCGQSHCDQMTVDALCFTFGTLAGRLLTDSLSFVCSPNPYSADSGAIATSVDVYSASLPSIGRAVLLRVAANLPEQKRKILRYSEEIVDFANENGISEIILVRSVPSIFCVDSQIRDWPFTVRGYGSAVGRLGIRKMEEYSETQEMLANTVFGELFECLKRRIADKERLSAVFMFFQQEVVMECARQMACVVCGTKEVKVPPSWNMLM